MTIHEYRKCDNVIVYRPFVLLVMDEGRGQMIERIGKKLKNLLLILGVIGLTILSSHLAFARDRDSSQARLEELKAKTGKGWQLKSSGGLVWMDPSDKRYWVSISGVIRIDEALYMIKARDRQGATAATPGFPTGSHIRKAEVDIVGGIGQDWNYTLGLDFILGDSGSRFHFSDSWVAYSGLCDNLEIFIGRHSANWFGLENSTSTSWYPFLERSAMSNAFYPGDGLGLLVDYWGDDFGFTFLALQPDHANRLVVPDNTGRRYGDDKWLGLARLSVAPIHEQGDVWHFGVSGVYRQNTAFLNGIGVNDFTFATRPDSRGRNTAALVALVDTNGRPLQANRAYLFDVEFARQCGPLLIEAEYANAMVGRLGDTQNLGHIRVYGWNILAQYMLTGEIHSYDVRDGNFGGIDVKTPCGAWEVAVRYDYLNLNDKNVRGGTEQDFTVGLNWYVNNNVRLSANYIRAYISPRLDARKRTLDIIGARLQIKFK